MSKKIKQLLKIMSSLRDPKKGCPWDLDQTYQSIAPHTIEEAYEVVDAIDSGNVLSLREELGDLLFQVIFLSQLANEENHFSFDDVVDEISTKMVRRHPHVFGSEEIDGKEKQAKSWESIKSFERKKKNIDHPKNSDNSALAGVIRNLPAILRAEKLQKRAASVGFDWPEIENVFDKVAEEIDEIKFEIGNRSSSERLEDEVGDLLFACVNLARKLGVEAESAIRKANQKFEKRFRLMEIQAEKENLTLKKLDIEKLESLWSWAKKRL